jgi:hypothetical protein
MPSREPDVVPALGQCGGMHCPKTDKTVPPLIGIRQRGRPLDPGCCGSLVRAVTVRPSHQPVISGEIQEAVAPFMSKQPARHPITLKTVRYTSPGVDAVTVRLDVAYKAGDAALRMDVYYPTEASSGAPAPAVVIVLGYPDLGVPDILGCQFKEMGMTVSWARLLAASGMVAIIYTTRSPATDVHAVLAHIRQNGAWLGIDGHRIGIFAASGFRGQR